MDDDADAVHRLGHRRFVGGADPYWEQISKLQFDFLVAADLKPWDVFVDVGCGSLRGGIRLIPFLDPGCYVGLDKHIELIIYGVAEELGMALYRRKRPRFLVSVDFSFEGLRDAPKFGIAQSLFSHLTRKDIALCLANLRPRVAAGCRFFATFIESATTADKPLVSYSHGRFCYTREEMENIGRGAGWTPFYIGAWGHPRGQHIIEFRA